MGINTREDILRPVLNWIGEVLGAPLASFFARLGVFEGGCTAESAAAICDPANELGLDAGAALRTLLENHLLLREELKEHQVRYTMLDAVHEYAVQRLSKRRELPRVRQRHAAFYVALAEEAEPFLMGANQREWLARLLQTNHNLRAALVWSEANDPQTLTRLSAALYRFWYSHAHFREGRQWLETALRHRAAATPKTQASILNGLGLMVLVAADYDACRRYLSEAVAIRRTLPGEEAALIGALNVLGNAGSQNQDTDLGVGYYSEALDIARRIGNRTLQSMLLGNLGVTYYYEADFPQARAYFAEALGMASREDDLLGYCIRSNNLGLACYQDGDIGQAAQLLRASLAISRELPNEIMQADTLGNLAKVAVDTGDLAGARAMLLEATALREAHGDRYAISLTLEAWAKLAVSESQPARALRLIALSHALLQDVSERIMPLGRLERERIEQAVRPLLSDREFQDCLESVGSQMPLSEVFAVMRADAAD
jgi:tetratricopeptide (TPR) repeat protein